MPRRSSDSRGWVIWKDVMPPVDATEIAAVGARLAGALEAQPAA